MSGDEQREAARVRGLAAIEASKRLKVAREIGAALGHVGALLRAWDAEWEREQTAIGQALRDGGFVKTGAEPGFRPWEMGCRKLGDIRDAVSRVLCAHGIEFTLVPGTRPEPEWARALEDRIEGGLVQLRRAFDEPIPAGERPAARDPWDDYPPGHMPAAGPFVRREDVTAREGAFSPFPATAVAAREVDQSGRVTGRQVGPVDMVREDE